MKKYALLGNSISFSLSPKVYKTMWAHLGYDADYSLIDVTENEFDSAVKMLIEKFNGFNITKPYKKQITKYLTGNTLPSINTVVKNSDGILCGHNTDTLGLTAHLASIKQTLSKKNVLFLGAGGVVESFLHFFSSAKKAQRPERIYVLNRTAANIRPLCFKYNAREYMGQEIDVVINCVSQGINVEDLYAKVNTSTLKLAYDTNYMPKVTPFMQYFDTVDTVVNGLPMLIFQAIAATQIYLNIVFDAAKTAELYNVVYKEITK